MIVFIPFCCFFFFFVFFVCLFFSELGKLADHKLGNSPRDSPCYRLNSVCWGHIFASEEVRMLITSLVLHT